jgi:tryptophan synthase alpha chain
MPSSRMLERSETAPAGLENRIDAVFARPHPALICYVPLGDPAIGFELPELYAECGVDVLEIGVPGGFPAYDGPTIASSLARAEHAGVTPARAADTIARWRETLLEQAMVWMTYPGDGAGALVDTAAGAGVDGLLLPAPARRFPVLARQLARRGLHLVHFLPYDPTLRDVREAVAKGRGYVMLQATPGLTGIRSEALPDSAWLIRDLRRLGLEAPLALGIGVSEPAQARAAVKMGADAVIVGSATVEAGLAGPEALRAFLRTLREALDAC